MDAATKRVFAIERNAFLVVSDGKLVAAPPTKGPTIYMYEREQVATCSIIDLTRTERNGAPGKALVAGLALGVAGAVGSDLLNRRTKVHGKMFLGLVTTTHTHRFDLYLEEDVNPLQVPMPASGPSHGFGFVEMASREEGEAAIEQLNGKEHNSRNMTVSETRPREDRGG